MKINGIKGHQRIVGYAFFTQSWANNETGSVTESPKPPAVFPGFAFLPVS